LVNPKPMRQREMYRALVELGYSVREVPYAMWREEVLALPRTHPENPLALFAGYYAGLEPVRMARLELRTRSRLPIADKNTRTVLNGMACPVFDRRLLTTYVESYVQRGLMPAPAAREPSAIVSASPSTRLIEDLIPRDGRVFDLYTRAKERQWDAAK